MERAEESLRRSTLAAPLWVAEEAAVGEVEAEAAPEGGRRACLVGCAVEAVDVEAASVAGRFVPRTLVCVCR